MPMPKIFSPKKVYHLSTVGVDSYDTLIHAFTGPHTECTQNLSNVSSQRSYFRQRKSNMGSGILLVFCLDS